MKASLSSPREASSLDALRPYQILDTPPEEVFDAFTRLAAQICRTPIALLNFIDGEHQWLKSTVGIDAMTPRDSGVGALLALHAARLIIPDTLADPHFATSPFANTAPEIRFYAGVPLKSPERHVLGVLCVMDQVPRKLSAAQLAALNCLAGELMHQLELRRQQRQGPAALRHSEERYRALYEDNPLIYFTLDTEGTVLSINQFGADFLGYEVTELVGFPGRKVVHDDDKAAVRQKFLAGLQNPERLAQWELRKVRKDGTVLWARETMRVVPGAAGSRVALIVCQDITDLKQAQNSLQKEREFLKAVLENIEDGIIACDADGVLTLFNHATRRFHGLPAEPLLPAQWAQHYSWYLADARTRMKSEDSPLFRAFKGEIVHNLEMTIMRKSDGVLRTMLASGQPLFDAAHNKIGAVVVLHDITKRKRAEQRLNYLTNYDPLTDLPNRTLFFDLLNQVLLSAAAQGTLAAVVMLDLDRFKRINDTLGRTISDLLLKAVAQRLLDCTREGDTVTRLNGDEFAIILAGIAQPTGAVSAVQRILDAFARPFLVDEHEIFITPSIGISLYPQDGNTAETLLDKADTAMYRAKEQGRNGYQCYVPVMAVKSPTTVVRQDMEIALRQALEHEELVLHYQPLIDLNSEKICGVEALLRWQRPQLGMVPRAQFIPLAEETGLILPIGIWALQQACAQNKAWQDSGLPPLRMAMKLSMRQFQQRNLVALVESLLTDTGLNPDYLELQLTENILQDSGSNTTLLILKELGIHLTIDNYGMGSSSLSTLRHMAIDKLKIDQSFVRNIPANVNNLAITSAIIHVAHSMNMQVVAEGVETAAQRDVLRALRCDKAQGYLFSKPLPGELLAQQLTRGSLQTARVAVS